MENEQNYLPRLVEVLTKLSEQKFFYIYNSCETYVCELTSGPCLWIRLCYWSNYFSIIINFLLSQIEFIPILGEWVSNLIIQIENFKNIK